MKKHISWIGLAVLGVVFFAQQGLSQETGSLSPEQMRAKILECMQLSKPGPQHQYIRSSVGEWDLTVRSWPNGPGGPVEESKGKSVITSILGGRFTQEKLTCQIKMPGPDGQMVDGIFEGIMTMGYNNYQKMFVSTWCDNMSTSIITMRGRRDPDTNVLTMYGEADDPMRDVHGRMLKSTVTPMGDGTGVYRMYDLQLADDYLIFEIIYAPSK